MTLICEDRSTYDPDIDPISRLSLTVECQPGQLGSIVDFLSGVEKQAGVYYAAFEANFIAPVASSVAVEEILDEVQVPEPVPIAEPVSRNSTGAKSHTGTEPITEGAQDAERPIQHANTDSLGTDNGREGSLPAEGESTRVESSDANGELARTAGEGAIEGSVERDSGGEDLPAGDGLEGRIG